MMRQRLMISVMAVMSMFMFSTVANAQFGLGALMSAGKAALDKDPDATIPKAKKKGKPIVVRWEGKTPIATWDPKELEIAFNQKWDSGDLAGKQVIYKVDEATGKVTRNDGQVKGSMSNDGTIESPNLGTLHFDASTNKITRNGEVIGTAGVNSAVCYGHTIGSFDSKVSPLLSAYVWFGLMISENQLTKWKTEQADAEAKAAQESAEREARMGQLKQQYAEDLKTCEVMIEKSNFTTAGRVRKGSIEDSSFRTIGRIRQDGSVFMIEDSSFRTIGRIKCVGMSGSNLRWQIEDSNFRTIGKFDGRSFDASNSENSGRYNNGSVENSKFSTIGRIKGTKNPVIIAACYYFFTFFK